MRKFVLWVSTMLMGAALAWPVWAAPVVSGVQIAVGGDGHEVVHILASAPLNVSKRFIPSNPDRLVFDMAKVKSSSIDLPDNYDGVLIATLRFGQFNATTSRLVIEVTSATTVASVAPEASGLRIDLVPTALAATTVAAPSKKPVMHAPIFTPPPLVQKHPVATVNPPAAVVAPTPTVAEDKKPLIVLDAGHGGQDPGASGLHRIHEKDITLGMVKAIRDGLLRTGRYRVALTRADDHYILLPERVEIARRQKADIFISIHADSNPMATARGLSVYTLSETASDKEAQALAERENKSDIIGGLDLNTADKEVASILIDLTQRETADKSAALADALVASMSPKITKLQVTHRFAGFRVLKAPDVPSVLIELGFLSNATDERLLQSEQYRDLVVASIVRGVDRFRALEKH